MKEEVYILDRGIRFVMNKRGNKIIFYYLSL